MLAPSRTQTTGLSGCIVLIYSFRKIITYLPTFVITNTWLFNKVEVKLIYRSIKLIQTPNYLLLSTYLVVT